MCRTLYLDNNYSNINNGNIYNGGLGELSRAYELGL